MLRMTNAHATFTGTRRDQITKRTVPVSVTGVEVLVQDAGQLAALDTFAQHSTYVLHWNVTDGYTVNGFFSPIASADSVQFEDRDDLITTEQSTPLSNVRLIRPPFGDEVMRGYILPITQGTGGVA